MYRQQISYVFSVFVKNVRQKKEKALRDEERERERGQEEKEKGEYIMLWKYDNCLFHYNNYIQLQLHVCSTANQMQCVVYHKTKGNSSSAFWTQVLVVQFHDP